MIELLGKALKHDQESKISGQFHRIVAERFYGCNPETIKAGIHLFLTYQMKTSSLICIFSFLHNMYVSILCSGSDDHLKHAGQQPVTHCPRMT